MLTIFIMQPAQIVIESDNVILDNECEPRHTPLEYKTKSQILHPAYISLNEDIVAIVKTVAGNSWVEETKNVVKKIKRI